MENITEDDYNAFIEVRNSGEVNMFDLVGVANLALLEKETVKIIIKNFDELEKKYK